MEGTWRLLLGAAPDLLIGIGLAGMLQVLLPPDMVGRWMGDEAGLLGLSVGMAAGALTPGGPYVMFPIAAALMSSGAGIGPMAGFVTARNVVTINRFLVWEVPFLGAPFAFARLLACVVMPPIAAVLLPAVYRLLHGKSGVQQHPSSVPETDAPREEVP